MDNHEYLEEGKVNKALVKTKIKKYVNKAKKLNATKVKIIQVKDRDKIEDMITQRQTKQGLASMIPTLFLLLGLNKKTSLKTVNKIATASIISWSALSAIIVFDEAYRYLGEKGVKNNCIGVQIYEGKNLVKYYLVNTDIKPKEFKELFKAAMEGKDLNLTLERLDLNNLEEKLNEEFYG